MKSLYLAHPFDARKSIREWEQRFEERTGITLNNPFYDQDRDDVAQVDRGERKRYEHLLASDLVSADLQFILQSDGLLAVIDGSVSYGTIMEIVYAHRSFNLPVYLIVTNGHHNHPWLKQHADHIFRSFDEAERFFVRMRLGVVI